MILRAAERPSVARFVSRHAMRFGARRFVPAESLDEIVPIFAELNARGARAVTGLFDDYALDADGVRIHEHGLAERPANVTFFVRGALGR